MTSRASNNPFVGIYSKSNEVRYERPIWERRGGGAKIIFDPNNGYYFTITGAPNGTQGSIHLNVDRFTQRVVVDNFKRIDMPNYPRTIHVKVECFDTRFPTRAPTQTPTPSPTRNPTASMRFSGKTVSGNFWRPERFFTNSQLLTLAFW